ncbi:MAG: hypothetical protein ABUS79_11945 [Pseudomonadota bacterium]
MTLSGIQNTAASKLGRQIRVARVHQLKDTTSGEVVDYGPF